MRNRGQVGDIADGVEVDNPDRVSGILPCRRSTASSMASSSSHSIPCELIERPLVFLDDLGHQGPPGFTTSVPLLLWLPVVPLAADDAGIPMLQQNAFNGHPYDPSVFSGTLPRLQLGALPLCEFGGDVNVNKRLLRVAPWPTCRPLSCGRSSRRGRRARSPEGRR